MSFRARDPDKPGWMSDTPSGECQLCGYSVIEFSRPNDEWNHVMRPDGKEADREYICAMCYMDALYKRLCAVEQEADDDETLRMRMADILTKTVNALKGDPGAMKGHGWSALPAVAKRFGQYARLRWGVQLKGQTVCAFVSREKAEATAALGSIDSGAPCEVVDLHAAQAADYIASLPNPPTPAEADEAIGGQ